MVGRKLGRRVDLKARLANKGPRKLLAIDCGGIRGVLSLKILDEIEQLLMVDFEQSIREIQRCKASSVQSALSTVAIGPCQHRSSNLFSPGNHQLR